jgi:glycosyltransferase involved in cell wall biosynthesis
LKKYTRLEKVFVELEMHKEILVANNIPKEKIITINPPSLFSPTYNHKHYNSKQINLLFASWNRGSYQRLHERGLLYCIDLLIVNPSTHLNILLRDNQTSEFINIITQHKLTDRINLININNIEHLSEIYSSTDYVIFTPTKRVTKDIPNSIIDGYMHGKPCIISNILDFKDIVKSSKLGIVIDDFNNPIKLESVSTKEYQQFVDNIYNYRFRYTSKEYLKILNYYIQ